MQIKICGITEKEKAIKIAQLGINFIGFIFYHKSKRFIQLEKANSIIQKIKLINSNIKSVGVFVNKELQDIKKITDQIALDILQLHGDEDAYYCEQIAKKIPYWKAIRVTHIDKIQSVINNYPHASGFLLDTYKTNQYGGTGEPFNWNIFREIKNIYPKKKFILAGGISKKIFKEAINENPWCIDLNSGVEESPGIKNISKIEEILKIAWQ